MTGEAKLQALRNQLRVEQTQRSHGFHGALSTTIARIAADSAIWTPNRRLAFQVLARLMAKRAEDAAEAYRRGANNLEA